jgi:hypothetical protein
MSKDVLVSTTILRQRRDEVRAELDDLRPYLPDQTVNFAERLLLQWEKAEKDAALEFVPTAKAERLTGWSADTLCDRAAAIDAGRPVPAKWRGLLAQRTTAGWTFCLSTIPVKETKAA